MGTQTVHPATTHTIRFGGETGNATLYAIPLNPNPAELPSLIGVTGKFTLETVRTDEEHHWGIVCDYNTTVTGHIKLNAAGRDWVRDVFLTSNPILARIRGTAAHGQHIGNQLQAGQTYIAATDRERRFVEDAARWNGLTLQHLYGDLWVAVPCGEDEQ